MSATLYALTHANHHPLDKGGITAGSQQRTILVEFESYDIAVAAHKSEAYQGALRALNSGAERDVRIVEGA